VSYNGGLGLANTSTLSIVPGGSVSLTGTVGNQVVFASTGTTLSVDGGSFSSTGNTGPSAGRFSNLAVNSGTFSASSAENNASRFYGINLLGANSSLTLNGGTTSVQGISTDGNVSTIRFNGGTLRVLAQPPVSAAGTFLPATGNLTALVQAGGAILDTNGQNAAISQALVHDPALGATPDGGLLKTGAGTLTLSGANTFTGGTTVQAGSLLVTGSLGGTVTVAGGTLGGTGSVGNIVANAGHVAPGLSAGELKADTVIFWPDSFFDVQLNPVEWDLLTVGESVILNDPVLNLLDLPSLSHYQGSQYMILQNNSTAPITGTFLGLPEGALFEAGGNQFAITYIGGEGNNDVVLTSVPEPATGLLLALALPAVAARLRRRRR